MPPLASVTSGTRGRILVTALAVGGIATVAGLGTFGQFTSTTSASTPVASGTVSIALGGTGAVNDLTVGAAGMVPGDSMQRAVDVVNSGTTDLSGISLGVTGAGSALTTDATNGLQLSVDSCSVAWSKTGNTYSCPGTVSSVLAQRPVLVSPAAVLATTALAPASTSHLRVTLSFVDTGSAAQNALQGLTDAVSFSFTGTQRAGTAL